MKSTRCILSIILGLLAGWLPLGAVTVLKNLQVEYQTNPLGIDVSQPRFNWQMESAIIARFFANAFSLFRKPHHEL